ncbi:helix-turn-helix domain-containing protein [Bradyrhizobium erythrophlei]|uniref:helix-turn-helix domain-containing protein n=1 Tax=Bradyrhizobium erythrophlei TaxID=1437360 RepID=UPI0035E527C1
MAQIWSTHLVRQRDRFPFWADVVAKTFVPVDCDARERATFHARIRTCRIGSVSISEVLAGPHRIERNHALLSSAPSDDMMVALHLCGSCGYCNDMVEGRMSPGTAIAIATDTPYTFDFGSTVHRVVFKVSRESLSVLPSDAEPRSAALRQSSLLLPRVIGVLRQIALSVLDDAARAPASDAEDGIEQALLALMQPALGRAVDDDAPGPASQQRYRQALSMIAANLKDPMLDRTAIAEGIGVSLRGLTRLFAAHGTTPERTIWSHRLAAIRRDLANPRRAGASITEIAFNWGFNDVAHFSRRFRQAYGVSPSEFRRQWIAAHRPPLE